MQMEEIKIQGPASLTLAHGETELSTDNYWVYDPKDGSVSLYDNDILISNPFL